MSASSRFIKFDYCLATLAFLLAGWVFTADLTAQTSWTSEPVVARVEMKFRVKDEILDQIDKGDLLTVLAEKDDDKLLVRTYSGVRGYVQKTNVLRLAEAVETYNDLVKEDEENAQLYTLRASAWWARGNVKMALADYDKAISLGLKEPHLYASRGLFHASLENYDKAVADYSKAIELGAKGDSAYINRAAVYMTQEKYEQAIKDYDKAIDVDDTKASTFQQRAIACKLSGNLDQAVEDFGQAIKTDSKYVPAWMGRGFVWYQTGDHDKAIKDFSEVIRLEPGSAQAYNNRGYNYQMSGDLKNAMKDFRKAVEIAPTFALAWLNIAWLLASGEDNIRDGKAAIEAATKAAKLREYKVLADIKALAAAFAEDGQFSIAIGWQEKAVGLAPNERKKAERDILAQYQAKKPFRLAEVKSGE